MNKICVQAVILLMGGLSFSCTLVGMSRYGIRAMRSAGETTPIKSFSSFPSKTNFRHISSFRNTVPVCPAGPSFTRNMYDSRTALFNSSYFNNAPAKRTYSIFEKLSNYASDIKSKLKKSFNFSHEKRVHDAFYNAFLKEGALEEIIKNEGNVVYPKEYINERVPLADNGKWKATNYTPLLFVIEQFGNVEKKDGMLNKHIWVEFMKKRPEEIEKIQYNIIRSLMNAGADINYKFETSVYANLKIFPGFFATMSTDNGLRFPLRSAVEALNVGAVKALLQAGAPVNEPVELVHASHRLPSEYSYQFQRYLLYLLKERNKKSAVSKEQNELFSKILSLLTARGAKESNEGERAPENFKKFREEYIAKEEEKRKEFEKEEKKFGKEEKQKSLTELLDLMPSATRKEITSAYKKKIGQIHPDRFAKGSKEQQKAIKETKELNSLYNEYKFQREKLD